LPRSSGSAASLGGIAASAEGVARILFVLFLVFAAVSLLLGRRSAV
jgi:uncharacterized membrane protein YtjA (UPF0391 family)